MAMNWNEMRLRPVLGNTWVIESWAMIPLYKLDEGRCILLDSGISHQREALDAFLRSQGLTCAAILGSHAHMDHAGNHAHLQKTQGAKIALSLGEAGALASVLAMSQGVYNLSPGQVAQRPTMGDIACGADILIMPEDREVVIEGAVFSICHTPGHSIDHIAITTPDGVCYLGDALMTGETLYGAKFPYAFSLGDYFASMEKLREEKATFYIAAHRGVYPTIAPLVDQELSFLKRRMEEMETLLSGSLSLEDFTLGICQNYHIAPKTLGDMAYYERAARAYLHYLIDQGRVEARLVEGRIRYSPKG